MTRKLSPGDLIEATTEELATYLRSGTVNTTALTRSLDYEGLNIDDWERLKRIHFCLADEVQAFITTLPDRVRRIKTEHQREPLHTRGEVRGSIDWSGTIRSRSETGYADRSRFVCNTPFTAYDIAENRVLKRLLWQIHRTVNTEFTDIDYDWRHDQWPDEQLQRFDRLYNQNVHLNRITDGHDITVTAHDMTTARRSRHALYTDAYDLYDTYQRLQADTFDGEISALLAETLIVPAATPTLFELFVIFRIIRRFSDATGTLQLIPIEGSSDALAHLKSDDRRIEIHHDSTGNLSIHEPLDSTYQSTHPQFARYADALTDYSDVLEDLTEDAHDPILYSGRPDITIEIYDTSSDDQLVAALLGEIKYSDAPQTFKQGLEELLAYRRFANKNGYLINNPGVSLTSLLITNGVTTSGTSDEVTHLNGTDLLDDAEQQHSDWIPPSLRRLVASE